MILTERKYLLHRGNMVKVLSPSPQENITGVAYNTKEIEILSDSGGYNLLSKMFWLSAHTKDCELVYVPVSFKPNDEFKSIFTGFGESNLSLVLVNYHSAPLSIKTLNVIIKSRPFQDHSINVPLILPTKFTYEYWTLKKKLTVKKHGKLLFLYGNRDTFMNLAETCLNLIVDDEYKEYYHLQLHFHKDLNENTYKSLGITFRYWNNT